ncbi:UPF0481 protein [Prunus yedoensis var. nudiflora]|uniref:UPF0481 protein n=1 Tax=Prunus yedoensis var. nudiflora TaxID=2094558 RepID=A0A314V3E1_PRUYE|nr:UPF0481 protein [Prunus yedoensis var. nudiflora]
MEGDKGKCSKVDGESTSVIINVGPTVEELKKNIEAKLLTHSPLQPCFLRAASSKFPRCETLVFTMPSLLIQGCEFGELDQSHHGVG